MSHFSVLIIGEEDIEKALYPFWELDLSAEEMRNDPRAEFNDHEDEHLKKYNDESVERVVMPDGRLLSPHDDMFRIEGRLGIGSDTHKVPENLERKKVKFTELYKTFEEFMLEYCGEERDEKMKRYGYWRNPSAKWDWYEIGGRFRGVFPVKQMNGDFTNVDQAAKIAIDWSQIHLTKEKNAKAVRFWRIIVNGEKPETKEEKDEVRFSIYKPEYFLNRYKNETMYARCQSSFKTWAVVKDGQWIEKGNMGWWTCSDETDEQAIAWELGFFKNFIEPLPPGTLLTVVDCHI